MYFKRCDHQTFGEYSISHLYFSERIHNSQEFPCTSYFQCVPSLILPDHAEYGTQNPKRTTISTSRSLESREQERGVFSADNNSHGLSSSLPRCYFTQEMALDYLDNSCLTAFCIQVNYAFKKRERARVGTDRFDFGFSYRFGSLPINTFQRRRMTGLVIRPHLLVYVRLMHVAQGHAGGF